jgi:hypothetical protein
MNDLLIRLLEFRADDATEIDELEQELEDWKEEFDDLLEEVES